MELNQVKVTVYGKEYTIKTSEQTEATLEYATYIDEKMKEIAERTGSFDPNRIATLVMLRMAHDIFTLKRELDSSAMREQEKLAAIEARLDDLLEENGLRENAPAILVISDDDDDEEDDGADDGESAAESIEIESEDKPE